MFCLQFFFKSIISCGLKSRSKSFFTTLVTKIKKKSAVLDYQQCISFHNFINRTQKWKNCKSCWKEMLKVKRRITELLSDKVKTVIWKKYDFRFLNLCDWAERHDFWPRLMLFFSSFLFPLKKEGRRKEEWDSKNRDQKSCLSARSTFVWLLIWT